MNDLHQFWQRVANGEQNDWLHARYRFLQRLAAGNRSLPPHVSQLASDVLAGHVGALDALHGVLTEHGTPLDHEELRRFPRVRDIFNRRTNNTSKQTKELRQFARPRLASGAPAPDLHPFWRRIANGYTGDWLHGRYRFLENLASGQHELPTHATQYANEVLAGDMGALDFLHDILLEHGNPMQQDEAKRFQPLQRLYNDQAMGVRGWPHGGPPPSSGSIQYAARRAPRGGFIARGLAYLGGRFLPKPSPVRMAANPPEPGSHEYSDQTTDYAIGTNHYGAHKLPSGYISGRETGFGMRHPNSRYQYTEVSPTAADPERRRRILAEHRPPKLDQDDVRAAVIDELRKVGFGFDDPHFGLPEGLKNAAEYADPVALSQRLWQDKKINFTPNQMREALGKIRDNPALYHNWYQQNQARLHWQNQRKVVIHRTRLHPLLQQLDMEFGGEHIGHLARLALSGDHEALLILRDALLDSPHADAHRIGARVNWDGIYRELNDTQHVGERESDRRINRLVRRGLA